MNECDCYDWIENIKKLNGMIDIALIHGFSYGGKYFKYCPWCGKRLYTIAAVTTDSPDTISDFQ